MSNINKQALRLTAEKAKDNFMPNLMVPTRDVLALLDELEEAEYQRENVIRVNCGLFENLTAAEKRIAEFDQRIRKQNRHACELFDEAKAQRQRVAELEASHSKLRESMAAIHNTIRLDGVRTSLAAIMGTAKRAHDESSAAAGISIKGE